jgi:hypothetical protein
MKSILIGLSIIAAFLAVAYVLGKIFGPYMLGANKGNHFLSHADNGISVILLLCLILFCAFIVGELSISHK